MVSTGAISRSGSPIFAPDLWGQGYPDGRETEGRDSMLKTTFLAYFSDLEREMVVAP
jgi:hypothetical protein